MGVKLASAALLTINEDDLCAILTDHFCDSYGPFRNLRCAYVHKESTGGFNVTFEAKPESETEEKK